MALSVKAVEHGNGDVSIGVESEGVYIPVASVPAARVAGLRERAADLQAKYEADKDDPAVKDAIAALPISAKGEQPESSEDEG